jgi:hypothetical protein
MYKFRLHLFYVLFIAALLISCTKDEQYPIAGTASPVGTPDTVAITVKTAVPSPVDISEIRGRYDFPRTMLYWVANKDSDGVYGFYGACSEHSQDQRIPMIPNGTNVLGATMPDGRCEGWVWALLDDEETDGFWVKRSDLQFYAHSQFQLVKDPPIQLFVPDPQGHQDGTLRRIHADTINFEDNYYIIDEQWPAGFTALYGSNADWSVTSRDNCRVFIDWEWYKGFPDHLADPKGHVPLTQSTSEISTSRILHDGSGGRPVPYESAVHDESVASPQMGFGDSILFILRLDSEIDSVETANCGTWNKIEPVSDDELRENQLYVVEGLPEGTYNIRSNAPNIPYGISGVLRQGIYRSSGTPGSSDLCGVYSLSGAHHWPGASGAGIGSWIYLGYNEHYELRIDSSWSMFASNGCGTWQRYSDDLSAPIVARAAPPQLSGGAEIERTHESIWSYCARVGANDLSGDLPEHLRAELDLMLSYPGPYWVEDYEGRCGFAEGSDTATFLVCNPYSGPWNTEDRWSRWANWPVRHYCWNKYQVGDTSTSPLGAEWVVLACGSYHCDLPTSIDIGKGYKHRLWWKAWGAYENSLYSGYVQDGYLFPRLSERRRDIDRSGYFSANWTVVPEGCTPYEAEELRNGDSFVYAYSLILGGFGKSADLLSKDMVARAKCLLDAGNIEISYTIPDGPPIKLPDLLTDWHGFTKEYQVKGEEPYKSYPGESWRTRESAGLIAYRHGITIDALSRLNGWGNHIDWPDAGDVILVPDYDRATIFEF